MKLKTHAYHLYMYAHSWYGQSITHAPVTRADTVQLLTESLLMRALSMCFTLVLVNYSLFQMENTPLRALGRATN